jgi:hypothetical protein
MSEVQLLRGQLSAAVSGKQALASKLGVSVGGLWLAHAQHAIAHALWYHNQGLASFMAFVDGLIAPDEFVRIAAIMARDTAVEVRGMCVRGDGRGKCVCPGSLESVVN